MRLKGLLSIINDSADSKETLVLEIPFKNMPLYPLGTRLYISTSDNLVYLEDVAIIEYTGNTRNGTRVECRDDGITTLFKAALELPLCINEGNGYSVYKGQVNFSRC